MFGSDGGIVNRWWACRFTAARGWSQLLAATLFPPRCCLCGFPGTRPDLDLCCFCQADLPWDEMPPAENRGGCGATPGLVTALRFEPPADELVRQLKYSGIIANARVLGELLAQAVRNRGEPLPRLLVPVPLHPSRWRERGFNQAQAIARYTGRSLGIAHSRGLVRRLRDTPSQTGLGLAERHRNVRGAFAIATDRAGARLRAAAHVAAVDDVTTTGSTLEEMKVLLLNAGVRRVDLWAVARAP
jgi:ComF family protein